MSHLQVILSTSLVKIAELSAIDVICKDNTMYPNSSSTTAINTAHAAVMGAVSQQKLTPGESRAKLINQ